jgi:very-short-patch-repair endonuclease
VGGVLSRTSNEGTGLFEPRFLRLRRGVGTPGRRWVLDRSSFLKIFVEDTRAVRWKIPDYGLSNGIALTCKEVYGWEFPHLFRGSPERLPDLDEVLPTAPTWVRMSKTKGFLLSRESFEEIFVNSDLTQEEARREYGVSHQALIRAVKAYPEFRAALLVKRGRLLSASKRQTESFFSKKVLVDLYDQGLSSRQAAERLGVGESIVLMDIHHHGLARSRSHILSWLNRLSDNEHAALTMLNGDMENLPEDPQGLFTVLVESYQRLVELSDRLKESNALLRTLVNRGEVERLHLTFAMNRAEIRLSRALIAAGIQHWRPFCLYKNWMADFGWPEEKLLVEVDGEYHRKCETTKARDRRKAKKAKELGYRTLRFSTEDIHRSLPTVVGQIAHELGHELPASLR